MRIASEQPPTARSSARCILTEKRLEKIEDWLET